WMSISERKICTTLPGPAQTMGSCRDHISNPVAQIGASHTGDAPMYVLPDTRRILPLWYRDKGHDGYYRSGWILDDGKSAYGGNVGRCYEDCTSQVLNTLRNNVD